MAMAMMAVTTAVQALGSIYEGNAAAAQSQAAANNASQNAYAVRLQTNAKEEAIRRRNAMRLGDLRASSAQTAFDPNGGSLATLQSRSAAQLELDALTERYNGELQSISLENDAQSYRNRASAQKRGGYLTAAGAVFNGAANGFAYGGLDKIGGQLVPASPYW